MTEASRPLRLAVLIDADNASAQIADKLFAEIATIGEASVRRIYGDFSTGLKAWLRVMPEHGILPQMNQANTTGKNASDIALVIDAMDLLHSDRFDGFCLVSSDSDFTRLAARIREWGVAVYGFGEKKTPKPFVQACQRFIYTENLGVEEETEEANEKGREGHPPSKAVPLIRRAVNALGDGQEWVNLGTVGQKIAALASDFDPRTYGSANLSGLVRKTGAFDVETFDGRMMIRKRPRALPKS